MVPVCFVAKQTPNIVIDDWWPSTFRDISPM